MLNKIFENKFLWPAVIYISTLFSLTEGLQVWKFVHDNGTKIFVQFFSQMLVRAVYHTLFRYILQFPSTVTKFRLLFLIYRLKMLQGMDKKRSMDGQALQEYGKDKPSVE